MRAVDAAEQRSNLKGSYLPLRMGGSVAESRGGVVRLFELRLLLRVYLRDSELRLASGTRSHDYLVALAAFLTGRLAMALPPGRRS